jgi:hypothetical protein
MSKGKKETEETDVVEFSDVHRPFDADTNLASLVNETITILKVEFQDATLGKVAIVEAEARGKTVRAYTFSKVISRQLEDIAKITASGKKVRARVRKVKNYLTLE